MDDKGYIHATNIQPCELCKRPEDMAERLRSRSGLPAGDWSFANFNPTNKDAEKALDRVAAWVDDEAHPWLFLFGTYGTGKTMLACCAAQSFIRRGVAVRFWVVPALLAQMGAAIGADQRGDSEFSQYQRLREELLNVPVLVLDDLGAHRPTEFAEERLYEILNTRYNDRSRLIITTNVEPEDEKGKPIMDGRIVSRLRDRSRTTPVEMRWQDYRTRSR